MPNALSSAPLHIVWDWNGTLKDDLTQMVTATNVSLAAIGGAPVNQATFQKAHCLPVRRFYDRLLGRPLSDSEWTLAQSAYERHTAGQPVVLRPGATNLLAWVQAQGHTQSLLSLTSHRHLVREVATAHIGAYFQRVDGRHTPETPKAAALSGHLAALNVPAHQVVLIGDTTDDANAAHACGARAVLHAGGFQLPQHLRTAGVPVAGTLDEAARVALRLLPHPSPPRRPMADTLLNGWSAKGGRHHH